MAKPLTGYNPRRTKGPGPAHVEHARRSVMELATNEAARMQLEAMRPGVDPVERERILAEAEANVREAARWALALGEPGKDPGHLVTDLSDPDAPVLQAYYGDDTMPAPAWALGHDGEGCVQLQHALHAPAKNATAMLDHVLAGTWDPEKARDRLAWAAAVLLGQRDPPDSEMIRATILALEDAVIGRVTQDAAGIVTWARKESTAAFGRIVDMAKFSSSMKTRFESNLHVMALAGLEPAQKLEVHHKHEMIDRMTREEQDRYAKTGEWPARLLTVETTAR